MIMNLLRKLLYHKQTTSSAEEDSDTIKVEIHSEVSKTINQINELNDKLRTTNAYKANKSVIGAFRR